MPGEDVDLAGRPGSSAALPLAAFRPRGVIFDLDGTLVDNIALHVEAFDVFAQRHGLPRLRREDRARLDGKRNSEVFPLVFGRQLTPEELVAFEHEKESLYREGSRGRLAPTPGLPRLLAALEARAIGVAVATSAPAANVAHTLAEAGLERLATRVVRGDQVPRGKPFPDVFLAAAALLGVPPGECLAFEDAPAGIAAVHAAGMRCVGIASGWAVDQLRALPDPPDAVVRDYDEFLGGPGAWLVSPPTDGAPRRDVS